MKDIKCGSKFILTEDFKTLDNKIHLKKDLVVSVISIHIGKSGKTLFLRVLRSKKIIARYYGNFDKGTYSRGTYHISNLSFKLYNEDFNNFMEEIEKDKRIGYSKLRSFDKEYKVLNSDFIR